MNWDNKEIPVEVILDQTCYFSASSKEENSRWMKNSIQRHHSKSKYKFNKGIQNNCFKTITH